MAGQFEAGTEDFEWTQGVTRRRWVLTNLGWAPLAAAAWGGALAALFTWWRGSDNAVDGPVKFIYFDVQGIAPIAYTVFAMALGIAAGALFRRGSSRRSRGRSWSSRRAHRHGALQARRGRSRARGGPGHCTGPGRQ